AGVLRLATTTSTHDSGLLVRLIPPFERSHHCRVDVIAVGTGAALKLGEDGDADVLVVHAESAEKAFMEAGHGIRRESFMFNHFVLLGPNDEVAKPEQSSVIEMLRRIADTKAVFISRGDDSGTHKRELSLWRTAGSRPQDWEGYLETGQGMGATLRIADEKRGYVLADHGTYLRMQDKFDLMPLTVRSAELKNVYSVITVDPGKNSKIHGQLADAWVDFLISTEAQRIINTYQVSGQELFKGSR
ncbi:UNVERIFIED_CONTAM: hypothetical protein GTU68_007621, partial [Idotea baltica]|nr:hypothetical protein [Idotea baltica]